MKKQYQITTFLWGFIVAIIHSNSIAQSNQHTDLLLEEIKQEEMIQLRRIQELNEKKMIQKKEDEDRQIQNEKMRQEQRLRELKYSFESRRYAFESRPDWWFSEGKSTSSLGSAPTREIGYRAANSKLGLGFTVIDNDESSGVDTDNSCPSYWNCNSDGAVRNGETIGFDFKFFFNEKRESFQPFWGLGIYYTDKIGVEKDSRTQKRYEELYSLEEPDLDVNLEIGAFIHIDRIFFGGSLGSVKNQLSIGFTF
jgi:hypothetical protein